MVRYQTFQLRLPQRPADGAHGRGEALGREDDRGAPRRGPGAAAKGREPRALRPLALK